MLKLAEACDVSAQCNVGVVCVLGKGIAEDCGASSVVVAWCR